jgi:DNA polymerase-3 subunit delta'
MQFKDVIGQNEVKNQLVQMVTENRLSHALLFLGKEGVGALPLARTFAQYINCEKANPPAAQNTGAASLFGEEEPAMEIISLKDSCGNCASCMKSAAMIHPDIHYSYPVYRKVSTRPALSADFATEWRKFTLENPYTNEYEWLQYINAENKQGNISRDETSEIIKYLNLKSFESEYKILIVWMPEALGTTGNHLLKLIEEPPKNTLFIFVAENESLILPTILSRTQLIKIPLLHNEDIKEALQLREGLDEEKASHIASLSNGNYFEARQLLQHASDNHEAQLREWLNSILRTGPAAQMKWIEDMAKTGREKQKQFLRLFNQMLHQAIRIETLGIETAARFGSEATNELASKLNKFSLAQKEAIVQELDQAVYHIERNGNAKLIFHALTIRIYHIVSNNSLILMA